MMADSNIMTAATMTHSRVFEPKKVDLNTGGRKWETSDEVNREQL